MRSPEKKGPKNFRKRTLRTGTTVVTVTFKNIKTAKSTAKKYRCVVKAALEQKPEEPTTTAGKITAIKQTSATKLAAEFSADMTGIKYTDLKIVRDETGAVVTVKSATVDKTDATKVTIETYEALTDGKAYTVTYTAADEAKTESSANFTATAGVVADIALNTYSIPANTPTVIKYQLLDANGVLIEEKGIGGKSKSDKVDISIENFSGYQNENEVTLYKTGDKATMKVVYHTWKYNNTNGDEEGKVEKTFEITAVDQSSVIETYEYSIVGNPGDVVDFKRDTLKTKLAVEDDVTADPHAKFSFRKADGTDITKNLDYTVESGNENVLLASGTVADGAKLTPVAVGATYLVIKNAAGTVVKTLPINVVAKRELSTMSVENSHVTISESQTAPSGAQKITIAVMDQHSDAYSKFAAGVPELKSGSATTAPVIGAASYNTAHTKVTFSVTAGANTKAGTYTYTVDLTDTEKTTNVKKATFSVTVSKELTAINNSLALVMTNDNGDVVSKVDTTVGMDAFTATTLHPTIVVKNNGVITRNATVADVVSVGGLKITKNGATVDAKSGAVYTGTGNSSDIITTQADVKVTVGAGTFADPIVKNLDAGTYTLSFKAYLGTDANGNAKYQNMSTSFVVEDSQKVFEASVKVEKIENGYTTLEQVFEDTDYVKFAYAGHELANATAGVDTYQYNSAKFTNVNNSVIRVEKVTMDVELAGTSASGNSNKVVRMTTPVNRTFTFVSGVTTTTAAKNAIIAVDNAYTATSTNSAIIRNYYTAKAAYDQLSTSEQTGFAASMAAIQAKAQTVAKNIITDVKASGTSTLNLDVFAVLGVTNATTADFTCYKEIIKASTADVTTTSALQAVVSNAAVLGHVSVVTDAAIATGVVIKAGKAGATVTIDSTLVTGPITNEPLTTAGLTYEVQGGITDKTITIKCDTYQAVYTLSTDGTKKVTSISAPVYSNI